MKKKNLIVLAAIAVSVSLIGCGNSAENVLAENVENTQVESMETIQTESMDMESSDIDKPAIDEPEQTYTERGNLFLLENVQHNPENNIDMNALEYDGRGYKLVESVSIYHTDNTLAGYTKEDFRVRVVVSSDEWSYCDFGDKTENYLVKTDELLEAISDEDKEILLAASVTPTPTPVSTEPPKTETSVPETPRVETPKVESTPTVSEPVVDIPVVAPPVEEQPVVVEPIIEQPTVIESDKYTPEEVIAIYRLVMEANGITWDPSLKGNWDDTIGQFPVEEWYLHDDNYFGGSWGTGFCPLEKGWIEKNAYSAVESYKMGDSGGNPWTKYYLEVTGSDENYVYLTEWHN